MDRRVCVAPMMDWTDRHCRYFLRGFTPHALLYTEMITAAAILRGDRARLLEFDAEEHPVALQLGGSNPQELALAARAGEEAGYDEINLNCGCPSDRVASGTFGACLMLQADRVAECVTAMREAVTVPVTVKMRIGVISTEKGGPKFSTLREAVARFDEADFEALHDFVRKVSDAGCQVAILHARKAVLGGLSPKDNREVPPLRFDVVKRIKAAFPHLPVIINGGIRDATVALDALTWCEGVMLGREAYHRPFLLRQLHETLYPAEVPVLQTREDMLERMARYAHDNLARGGRLSTITRHMLGLYGGQPGARDFRRFLSEGAREVGASADLLRQAAKLLTNRPAEPMS